MIIHVLVFLDYGGDQIRGGFSTAALAEAERDRLIEEAEQGEKQLYINCLVIHPVPLDESGVNL